MAQNIVIRGVTYANAPEIDVPTSGGGTAKFMDTSDATLDNGNKLLNGETGYGNGVKYTGSISKKAAATYTPTTSDQVIAAGQYLEGAQTVKGDSNLQAQYIADGVTLFGIVGTLAAAVISQDPTTKIVSIS